jgi:hypothetical protein
LGVRLGYMARPCLKNSKQKKKSEVYEEEEDMLKSISQRKLLRRSDIEDLDDKE